MLFKNNKILKILNIFLILFKFNFFLLFFLPFLLLHLLENLRAVAFSRLFHLLSPERLISLKTKSGSIILELVSSPSLAKVKFQFFYEDACAFGVIAAVLGAHFVHFLEHVTCHYRDNTGAVTAHFFLELNLFLLAPNNVIHKI